MGLFGRDDKDLRESSKDPLKEYRPTETRSQGFEPRSSSPQAQPGRAAAKESTTVDKESGEFGEIQAYLGRGSHASGRFSFDGTVRVDGHMEGEIAAQDTLIVGERAIVTAQISGNTVVIRGKVTGDINARKRVEIRAPGTLFGNIVTPSLVIHEGVIFEGHCSMGSNLEARGGDSKVTPLPKEEKGGNGVVARVSSEATK
jgi:cytoskeletal protein CcmA (bactofilin family)